MSGFMNDISPKIAYEFLMEASEMNPGPWVGHSIYAAKAAKRIAEKIPALDPDTAEAYGYIHDIGRRFGVTKMRHAIDGYRFLENARYSDAARIALTHSFPTKNVSHSVGDWDCSDEDHEFVKQYIETVEYTLYDELIQLCDALAMPTGFTLVERRLIDVAIRYGVDHNTVKRWKAFFAIQNKIENMLGHSIYKLFPEIQHEVFNKSLSERIEP